MKGLFIPGITAEMFRNGCLESIEALMAEGEMYDIDYSPLPKGHGALKDADALRKSIHESIEECVKWADEVKEGEMYARVSQSIGTFTECSLRIKNAPTIIEADKTESEGKE